MKRGPNSNTYSSQIVKTSAVNPIRKNIPHTIFPAELYNINVISVSVVGVCVVDSGVGDADGCVVVTAGVGETLGDSDGAAEGCGVGFTLGAPVGAVVGAVVGDGVWQLANMTSNTKIYIRI